MTTLGTRSLSELPKAATRGGGDCLHQRLRRTSSTENRGTEHNRDMAERLTAPIRVAGSVRPAGLCQSQNTVWRSLGSSFWYTVAGSIAASPMVIEAVRVLVPSALLYISAP